MATPADPGRPVFVALADATAATWMPRLSASPGATATELAAELPISHKAVLKQLDALQVAGLVEETAAGTDGACVTGPTPAALGGSDLG